MENAIHIQHRPNGLFMLAILLQAALLALVVYIYPNLPERIPTHFGLSGAVDGWGDKTTIWFLPAIAIVLQVLIVWAASHPEKLNYPVAITPQNRDKNYNQAVSLLYWLTIAVTTIMTLIVLATYRSSINPGTGISPFWIVGILVLALGIGPFMMLKMRKNG
jgi:uncharacterized membrane protein